MNWKRRIDTIVAIVSLALIVLGGILYLFLSGFQIIGPIIVIIGFVLLILEALGGREGEKKQSRTVTPGPQPVEVGGGGQRYWADEP